jgi:hypothetical protein
MSLRSFADSNSIEARQFLLDRKCERNHPKRHRTGKRKGKMSRKKRSRLKHWAAIRAKETQKYRAAVRAFWSGEIEMHP